MKLPIKWIKDYVTLGKVSVAEVAHKLTFAGLEVSGDEIEVTTNRPDWLSVIGIARELSAIYNKKLKEPKINKPKTSARVQPADITVVDKVGCPLYTGRVIENVKVAASPGWIKERLAEMDSRPINNIVDLTNFCLFESGQPMHAFDLDKLAGRKVIVRKARKGEAITTIDNVRHKLDPDILVIADAEKPVAIAGIMGGADTEVSSSTKNILLESAYFDPVLVRRAKKKLGGISDSSYRFERGVDLGMVRAASDRASNLIMEFSPQAEAGVMKAIGRKEPTDVIVKLDIDYANQLLGTNISAMKMSQILTSLGLKISTKSQKSITVQVPSFRRDIKLDVDLIEEIARIHGYDNIKETSKGISLDIIPGLDEALIKKEAKIKNILTTLGFNEIITYSLIAEKDNHGGIPLANPISADYRVLRSSLIPGMIKVINHNLNQRENNLKLFELSRVYPEKLHLSISLTGAGYTLFDLKGALENTLRALGIKLFETVPEDQPVYKNGTGAALVIDTKKIGMIGEVKGVEEKVFVAELDFEKTLRYPAPEKSFKALPRYPSVMQDISLVIAEDTTHHQIEKLIKSAGGELVKKIKLIDIYRGKQISANKKSLTYSITYSHPGRTLTDQEVSVSHQKICDALKNELSALIRTQ